jgi:recombination protein RecA
VANPKLAAFAAKMVTDYGAAKVSNEPPPVIVPTGITSMDWALAIGGWQLGRIYEIVGPKDAGKTLVVIYALREHRKKFPDRGVVYVNIEKTFSGKWARLHGLDCSDDARSAGTWLPLQASTSEEASNMARDAIGSGLYSCLAIDSVGAMESAKVLDLEAGKDTMGKNAQVITKLVKALAGLGAEHQCTVLLVNQPRANFSMFGGDISAGPKALTHSTTAQIKMSSLSGVKDVRKLRLLGDDAAELTTIGARSVARVPRMKNGTPGRKADWFIMKQASAEFGPAGVDLADDALSLGIRLQVIERSGNSHYILPGGKKFNGRDAVGAYLRKNPEAMAEIRAAIPFEDPILDPTEEATA